MTTYRLSELGDDKDYLWLVPTHGVEMGFGAAGDYEAHAHRHFVDIMYAPGGIASSPGEEICQLLVVPPRTAFGPVRTEPFFFLKVVEGDEPVSIPDKIVGDELVLLGEGGSLVRASGEFELDLGYLDPRDGSRHRLVLSSHGDSLSATSSAGWELTIRP